MKRKGSIARTAAVALTIALVAAGPAAAQSWQWESRPDGASAFIQAGAARFSVRCTDDSGGQVTARYQPANIAAVTLQPTPFGGQGPAGDGRTSGYLFFKFDSSSVQQFLHRSPAGNAFVTDAASGDVLLRLLRSDNTLTVTPSPAPVPVLDTFPLRGSSRAIAAALDDCARPPDPPAPPPNVAVNPAPEAPIETTPPAPQPTPEATPVAPPVTPPPAPETALETPPFAPDGRVIGQAGSFVVLAEGAGCFRSQRIVVMAPQPDAFLAQRAILQQLIAEVQAVVLADCPDAEQLRVSGYVGDAQVYDGVAARATLWTLIDLVLPGEIGAGPVVAAAPPAEMPSAPPPTEAPALPPAPEPSPPPETTQPPESTLIPETPSTPEAPPTDEPAPQVSSLFGRPAAPSESAPAEAMQPAIAGAIACPGRDAMGFAAPTGDDSHFSPDALTYSEAGEQVLITPELGARLYDTGAGDDVVYVYDLHAGTEVIGGQGGDTIVLCAMDDVSVVVMLGYASGGDSEPDTLILEPDVFLDVPDGFTREVRVFGFSQPADRLVLRLPPGVADPTIDDRGTGSVVIATGAVRVQLLTLFTSTLSGFDPAGLLVERVDAPATADTPVVAGPPGPAGAGITCPPAPNPADYAAPAEAHGDSYAYGREGEAILVTQETGIFSHYAGAGDDVVYVFGGNAGMHVNLDAGNDTLIFCALNEISYSVAGGDELSSFDSDTDVIIFEPGAFRGIPSGFQRGFFIYSIADANDRIVLRLPPDLDAELVDFERGFPKILVGDTVIQLSPTTREPMQPTDPSMVIIERVPG